MSSTPEKQVEYRGPIRVAAPFQQHKASAKEQGPTGASTEKGNATPPREQ